MRFPGSISYLLRNIGLEIFAFILIRLWFGLSPEPAKLVVKKSFWIAFSRCWIHLLPLTVSLVLIWLNLKGFYIAQTFSQYSIGDLTDQSNSVTLALIQIAAKVQVCCSTILSSHHRVLTKHPGTSHHCEFLYRALSSHQRFFIARWGSPRSRYIWTVVCPFELFLVARFLGWYLEYCDFGPMEGYVACELHRFGRPNCDYSRACKRRSDVATANGEQLYSIRTRFAVRD